MHCDLRSEVHFLMGMFFLLVFFPLSAQANDAWFIDTRHATLQGRQEGIEHLLVARLNRDNIGRLYWETSDKEQFLQTHDPDIPLVIIIHGNWMKFSEAKAHGIAFRKLSKKLGEHRLLVWSWPSERTNRGIRQDALLKARRADVQAQFLAAFLKKLRPGSKVSLVGFSFGAKLACETLHLLADTAEYPNSEEEDKYGHGLKLRTVLLAAAMDQHSLKPGRQYGKALLSTEKMLVHVNRQDSTLKWYPLLVSCHGPRAIGKEGVAMSGFPNEYRNKILSRDLQRLIGHDHGFMASLLGFLAFREDFRQYALFE